MILLIFLKRFLHNAWYRAYGREVIIIIISILGSEIWERDVRKLMSLIPVSFRPMVTFLGLI